MPANAVVASNAVTRRCAVRARPCLMSRQTGPASAPRTPAAFSRIPRREHKEMVVTGAPLINFRPGFRAAELSHSAHRQVVNDVGFRGKSPRRMGGRIFRG